MTFTLLEKEECNVLSCLSREEALLARSNIQELILATDMDLHKTLLEQFKQTVVVFDGNDSAHRMAVMKIIVKAADLSNEARPRPVNHRWSDCLMEEFFTQGDMEKVLFSFFLSHSRIYLVLKNSIVSKCQLTVEARVQSCSFDGQGKS